MAGAPEDDLDSKLGVWFYWIRRNYLALKSQLGERADKLLGTVREDYEVSMRIYDSIKTTTGVTEQ